MPSIRAGAEPSALVLAERADGPDIMGRSAQARFLAEVVAHRRVETPFTVGLMGPAGSGKSHFLQNLLGAARAFGSGSLAAGQASPFVPSIVTMSLDAAALGADPVEAIAAEVLEALTPGHPQLAAEARHAGGDPVKAARDINTHLNEARRRLDAERQTLDGLKTREARLSESVLFEASGSRVDAYARGNRARIERALRSFGFLRGDPVAIYKELVREAAEAGGPLGRVGLALRALWTYRGQGRLLVYAVILLVIAWGAGLAQGDQQDWLESLRGWGDKAAPVADWAQRNTHWLHPLATAATILAVVAIVWNLVRAARFLQPILRGATLLQIDLSERRRDLNGLVAHQIRLVDTLAGEVDASASHAEEAERRASQFLAESRATGAGSTNPFAAGSRDPARLFLADVSRAIGTADNAPGRIVVAIDGLDHVAPEAAATLVRTARTLFGPGFVTVLAGDRAHLSSGFAEADPARAAAEMGRAVQLTYELGGTETGTLSPKDYARHLIEGRSAVVEPSVDATRSALDTPWRPREADTVAALAPFAGGSPRATKTFVNLYRVARADPRLKGAEPPVFTALALALALASHGYPEDWTALESVSKGEAPQEPGVLGEALLAARQASGGPVEFAQARRALEVARNYTARV